MELVLRPRVAVLEIGASGAADQERVAGEDPIAHQEAVGIVGVAGRIEHVEREALDRHLVAVRDPHRHHVGLALLAHDGDAMGAVTQLAEPGDVVGVQMRVDRLDQPEVELPEQLAIAIDLLQHGVDDQGFAAGTARQHIAVGSGHAVEQLAKDHGHVRAAPSSCQAGIAVDAPSASRCCRATTNPCPNADGGRGHPTPAHRPAD